MPVTHIARIHELAEQQHGYFTTAQATAAGIRRSALTLMARRGILERVSQGLYRIASYPVSPLGSYMEAVLWPQRGVQAVLSHATALERHGLSNVSPSKIHITLTPEHRVRRRVPRHLVLHYAALTRGEVEVVNGVPVTTPVRSIQDAHAAHLNPALIRQAIADGRREGVLREGDLQLLRTLITVPRGIRPQRGDSRRRLLGLGAPGAVRATEARRQVDSLWQSLCLEREADRVLCGRGKLGQAVDHPEGEQHGGPGAHGDAGVSVLDPAHRLARGKGAGRHDL